MPWLRGLIGGDKRDRTADLLNAIQALSQLSYTPVFNFPEYLIRNDVQSAALAVCLTTFCGISNL